MYIYICVCECMRVKLRYINIHLRNVFKRITHTYMDTYIYIYIYIYIYTSTTHITTKRMCIYCVLNTHTHTFNVSICVFMHACILKHWHAWPHSRNISNVYCYAHNINTHTQAHSYISRFIWYNRCAHNYMHGTHKYIYV